MTRCTPSGMSAPMSLRGLRSTSARSPTPRSLSCTTWCTSLIRSHIAARWLIYTVEGNPITYFETSGPNGRLFKLFPQAGSSAVSAADLASTRAAAARRSTEQRPRIERHTHAHDLPVPDAGPVGDRDRRLAVARSSNQVITSSPSPTILTTSAPWGLHTSRGRRGGEFHARMGSASTLPSPG